MQTYDQETMERFWRHRIDKVKSKQIGYPCRCGPRSAKATSSGRPSPMCSWIPVHTNISMKSSISCIRTPHTLLTFDSRSDASVTDVNRFFFRRHKQLTQLLIWDRRGGWSILLGRFQFRTTVRRAGCCDGYARICRLGVYISFTAAYRSSIFLRRKTEDRIKSAR